MFLLFETFLSCLLVLKFPYFPVYSVVVDLHCDFSDVLWRVHDHWLFYNVVGNSMSGSTIFADVLWHVPPWWLSWESGLHLIHIFSSCSPSWVIAFLFLIDIYSSEFGVMTQPVLTPDQMWCAGNSADEPTYFCHNQLSSSLEPAVSLLKYDWLPV